MGQDSTDIEVKTAGNVHPHRTALSSSFLRLDYLLLSQRAEPNAQANLFSNLQTVAIQERLAPHWPIPHLRPIPTREGGEA